VKTHTIESIYKCFPNLDVASSLAFIVKSVNTSDIGAFMIASQEEEVLGILDLVAHEKQYGLKRMLSSINIIPQKKEVGAWREAAHLKHADKIGVLAMDVSHDLYWCF
jgi:hypothetical protein